MAVAGRSFIFVPFSMFNFCDWTVVMTYTKRTELDLIITVPSDVVRDCFFFCVRAMRMFECVIQHTVFRYDTVHGT
jgi:hypothetical protein